MADTDTESYINPQKFGSIVPQNQTNPSKFFTNFLYKSVIVTIFLLLLPLFPSQAPEFINQTRSWELLQIVFVGIAVSYGLFSKRSDETEKDHNSKFDNAHSYVSRFLQVSSVFDEEAETQSAFDENKVQTWNSQYYRGDPLVVVAPESSVLEEQSSPVSRNGEKPLLLPIRSLKSQVDDSDIIESTIESNSNMGSKRFSRNSSKTRNGDFGGSDFQNLEAKTEENVVLRSPIPWRSRSGRMEMNEDLDSPPLYSLPPSMADSEFNRLESKSFRSQSFRSSKPNSSFPSPSLNSPENFSNSPSFSSGSQAKNIEDSVRKKTNHMSSPPPPAPPPPPPLIPKSHLMKSYSTVTDDVVFGERKLNRSVRSVPKNSSGSGREDVPNRGISVSESKSRTQVEPIQGGMKSTEFKKTRLISESSKLGSKQTFYEYPNDENEEIVEKVVVETDEDSEESEDDDSVLERSTEIEEVADKNVCDGGPDVDKKADEFIAKFREQIRLQRIESIKKSTGQFGKNSSR